MRMVRQLKNGLGHYADGRASLVVGTRYHIPTADLMIRWWNAYQTDVDAVIIV